MKKEQDSLGNRMKDYESVSKNRMTRRSPVIIRCDGKAFHNFCKRFERPYDKFFNDCMNAVMVKLCSEIQGAKYGERHSDEISILVTDYDKVTTDAYFDYEVQKIVSVVAGMATAELCRHLAIKEREYETCSKNFDEIYTKRHVISWNESWPVFDCRCFNIPKEEISNYFWWRMLDAKRNSINMMAQSLFSHKQLQGKTCDEMQELLFSEKGINWNDVYQGQKAGFCCYKVVEKRVVEQGPNEGQEFERRVWNIEPSVASKSELDGLLHMVLNPV